MAAINRHTERLSRRVAFCVCPPVRPSRPIRHDVSLPDAVPPAKAEAICRISRPTESCMKNSQPRMSSGKPRTNVQQRQNTLAFSSRQPLHSRLPAKSQEA